ncbi:MAG: phage minor head protein [Elusimicrobiota bacterium]
MKHPLKNKNTRARYHRYYLRQHKRQTERMLERLVRYFRKQRNRVIENLGRKRGLAEETFNQGIEIKIAYDEFRNLFEDELRKAGQEKLELVGTGGTFRLETDIVEWLDEKSDVFSKSINKTTFDRLKQEFQESLSEGEGRRELVNRIKDTYKDIEKNRAKTIARTEIHSSVQKGTIEGYGQAGLETKIWVSVLSPTTRPEHALIDGEERPIKMSFSNGLDYPGDPKGLPSQIINCQCTI